MRVHYLQHVAFEGLGSMEGYLRSRGHELTATHLYKGDALPQIDEFEVLIVMGGPMGVGDEDQYPWLSDEKRFIKTAIEQGKKILGICLGAQLIADVMGARVTKNPHREIGWFKIQPDAGLAQTCLAEVFNYELEVFHWHGDTFAIPDGATPIASSEACQNQGFVYENRVIALQFHLETSYESAIALIENCRDELDDSRYVQSEREMLGDPAWFMSLNHSMDDVLASLAI